MKYTEEHFEYRTPKKPKIHFQWGIHFSWKLIFAAILLFAVIFYIADRGAKPHSVKPEDYKIICVTEDSETNTSHRTGSTTQTKYLVCSVRYTDSNGDTRSGEFRVPRYLEKTLLSAGYSAGQYIGNLCYNYNHPDELSVKFFRRHVRPFYERSCPKISESDAIDFCQDMSDALAEEDYETIGSHIYHDESFGVDADTAKQLLEEEGVTSDYYFEIDEFSEYRNIPDTIFCFSNTDDDASAYMGLARANDQFYIRM